MPALLQLWIVIVTVALLLVAILTARMIARQLGKVTEDLSRLTAALTESAEQIELAAREIRGLAALAQDCIAPVQSVVEQFAAIGRRTARISSALLESVEKPVFTAAAVSQGLKSAASQFTTRILNRITHRSSSINGDESHE